MKIDLTQSQVAGLELHLWIENHDMSISEEDRKKLWEMIKAYGHQKATEALQEFSQKRQVKTKTSRKEEALLRAIEIEDTVSYAEAAKLAKMDMQDVYDIALRLIEKGLVTQKEDGRLTVYAP